MQRAFSVLDALAEADTELGTNEIARRTGINASSVSRLLATLVAGGLVEHVPDSGRYRLGLRLLQLGNVVLARLDLRQIARPHLQALVESTRETATLSAPGELDAVTVDFVQSPSSVQGVARLGRPSVAHATATGKVLEGKYPMEATAFYIHSRIHRSNHAAQCVLHTHMPYTTALTVIVMGLIYLALRLMLFGTPRAFISGQILLAVPIGMALIVVSKAGPRKFQM